MNQRTSTVSGKPERIEEPEEDEGGLVRGREEGGYRVHEADHSKGMMR